MSDAQIPFGVDDLAGFETQSQTTATPLIKKRARRKKVTRGNFTRFQEEAMMKNTPDILEAFYPAVVASLKKGDTKTIELVGKMFGIVKQEQGVVIQQIVQQAPVQESDSPRTFEGLLLAISAKRAAVAEQQQLAQPRPPGPSRAITIDQSPEPEPTE